MNLKIIVFVIIWTLLSNSAQAASRFIDGIESYFLSNIVSDSSTKYLFAGDFTNQKLLMIDSEQEKVVREFNVDNNSFTDMEFSKDNKYLAIAGGSLNILNLESLQMTEVPLDFRVAGATFDYKNDLYLTTQSGGWQPLKLYDLDSQSIIWQSQEPKIPDVYSSSSLDSNTAGTRLFVSEYGTPGYVNNFDVSHQNPNKNSMIEKNDGRSISNAVYVDKHDVLVTTDHSIQIWDADDLSLLHEESIGIHLRGLDADPQGNFIYTVHDNWGDEDYIKLLKFDLAHNNIIDSYDIETRGFDYLTRELAVDHTGNKVFTLVSDSYYPFETHLSKIEIIDVNNYSDDGSVWPKLPTLPKSPITPKAPIPPNLNSLFAPTLPKSPKTPTAPKSPTPPASLAFYSVSDLNVDQNIKTIVNPEPASMLLFGSGLAGIFLKRRKK